MLSFKQYLGEVLDTPYKWKLSTDESRVKIYKFTAENKIEYEVIFLRHMGNIVSDWEVSFDVTESTFRVLGKSAETDAFTLTGTRDQFKVFATVQDIIAHFITDFTPDIIDFMAAEKNSRKLYERFTANFEKKYPELYKTYIAWSNTQGVNYIMSRSFAKEVLNGVNTTSRFYKIIPSAYREELK